jgi:hypothetical protein
MGAKQGLRSDVYGSDLYIYVYVYDSTNGFSLGALGILANRTR